MIDLHTHSTCSDGSLPPARLAEAGRAAGLSAMALTDHDTTAGLPAFLAACAASGLRGVPGVEISVDYNPGSMHMLGYFVPPADAGLEAGLARLRDGRAERNRRILERLRELGCPLAWDEVRALAGSDIVGRPHFAQALVARGFVKSKEEAFSRYLAKGRPAYLDRAKFGPAESVALIRASGGVPVLAHPHSLYLRPAALRELVGGLREAGLEGIETRHPEHNRVETGQFERIAGEFGLVATGGTDFHGALTPDLKLGRGFGELDVPDDVVDRLAARRGASAGTGP